MKSKIISYCLFCALLTVVTKFGLQAVIEYENRQFEKERAVKDTVVQAWPLTGKAVLNDSIFEYGPWNWTFTDTVHDVHIHFDGATKELFLRSDSGNVVFTYDHTEK